MYISAVNLNMSHIFLGRFDDLALDLEHDLH